ncbi:MAG: aldolase/citrate lyase family protein [Nitrososphaerales archaeon]
MKNLLRDKISKKKFALGIFISIPHGDIAELIARSGFDFVLLDTEHSPTSLETAETLLQIMDGYGMTTLIRVPWNDMVMTKRALDIGAHGIIVPMVSNKREAEYAVKSMRYPPEGFRGFGPRRAMLFDKDYVNTANKELMLIVQIENEEGVKNAESILEVDGVDGVLVGPYDLSLNLGIYGKLENPKFIKAIKDIAYAAKKNGKIASTYATEDTIDYWLNYGYNMLLLGMDILIFSKALNDLLKIAKEKVEKNFKA